MSRHLAMSLEPSDAFLALLRLKAASEVGRWPAQLSGRFRGTVEREFAAMESTVRTLGVCYADLEERGIATVDRSAHSRFGDIDSAIHLGACPIEVSVDMDHLKVALERGDRDTRESMATLASSLRMALWYAVRTDLLVCIQLQRSGEDLTPDAALRFVDAYLVAAWSGAEPPQPPLPSPEVNADLAPAGSFHTPPPPGEGALLPNQESTAVFKVESLGELDPQLFGGSMNLSAGALATMEMDRLSLSAAELQRMGLPPPATPPPSPSGGARMPSLAAPPPPPLSSFAELDGTVLPTLQLKISDVLSDDAQFFLAQTGARWPCDASELESAHQLLTERIRRDIPDVDPVTASQWFGRLSRGYDELRRWTR